jgi:hypothetical protein
MFHSQALQNRFYLKSGFLVLNVCTIWQPWYAAAKLFEKVRRRLTAIRALPFFVEKILWPLKLEKSLAEGKKAETVF